MTEYNGFENYETWLVVCNMLDDEATRQQVEEIASGLYKVAGRHLFGNVASIMANDDTSPDGVFTGGVDLAVVDTEYLSEYICEYMLNAWYVEEPLGTPEEYDTITAVLSAKPVDKLEVFNALAKQDGWTAVRSLCSYYKVPRCSFTPVVKDYLYRNLTHTKKIGTPSDQYARQLFKRWCRSSTIHIYSTEKRVGKFTTQKRTLVDEFQTELVDSGMLQVEGSTEYVLNGRRNMQVHFTVKDYQLVKYIQKRY